MKMRSGIFSLLALSGCSPLPAQQYEARPIVAETVALYGVTERPLMWVRDGVTAIYSFDPDGVRIDYVEGVDYVLTGNGIARTPVSSIYDFSTYAIESNPDGTFTWVGSPRNPPFVRFKHAYVDYAAHAPDETIPALAPTPVTGKVMAAGDSITAAANTISWDAFATDADGYLGLLRTHFSGDFTVENFSESGASLSMLTDALPGILASDPPSVFIIAFGMNDHSSGVANVGAFKAELIADANQIISAGGRVIFVGFPRKNQAWEFYDEPAVIAYNNAIEEAAAATGSAFVDVKAMFDRARQRKAFIELFGDNYHHPGNYGQRIYFSGILPHLLSTPLASSDVPGYVALP